jgi:hypothetical protein
VLLNLLAIVATAAIGYMGVARGFYRSGLTLISFVAAGTIAFALFGPLAALGPLDTHSGTWYYAGDAFMLWLVFCAAFLAIRMGADKLASAEAKFSLWANRIGGGLLGAVTGYLAVGLSIILVEMLPTPPDFMGYEPFRYQKTGTHDTVRRGDTLWLSWDRGTLGLFNFISGGALGSESGAIVRRYGDVYPPVEMREPGYRPVCDIDDCLYYHWYRRWEYAGPGVAGSPLPEPGKSMTGDREGLVLRPNEQMRVPIQDEKNQSLRFDVRIINVARGDHIAGFPDERPPADSNFLFVSLRFQPSGTLPAEIDSSRFYLRNTMNDRVGSSPMIMGGAKAGQPQPEPDVPDIASTAVPRGLRFGSAGGTDGGAASHIYLWNGASFAFKDAAEREDRIFVFTISKSQKIDGEFIRLMVDPKPPVPAPAAPTPAKSAPAAASTAAKTAPVVATPSAPAAVTPTASKS